MSWDLYAQDLPAEAKSVSEIPADFSPRTLGPRTEIIAKIKEVVPTADFSDPSWGLVDGPGYSIEISLGDDEVNCFAFHVHGDELPIGWIEAILKRLNLRAIDMQSAELFNREAAVESFNQWKAYRDRSTGKDRNEGS